MEIFGLMNVRYVLVQRGSLLYTIKANCTTCQFPMIDGKVSSFVPGLLSRVLSRFEPALGRLEPIFLLFRIV